MPRTVETALAKLSVSASSLAACADLDEEWSIIKKAFFRKALVAHPDKGGDAAAFRVVQSAFEALRSLYDGADAGFSFTSSTATSTESESAPFDVPSWEYYAEAAQEVVPLYCVERARSGRSNCQAKGSAKNCRDECIPLGELRVGWMNSETGQYGGWVHLKCWRVPNRVWLGLPDPNKVTDERNFEAALRSMGGVLLSGLGALPADDMRRVTRYCARSRRPCPAAQSVYAHMAQWPPPSPRSREHMRSGRRLAMHLRASAHGTVAAASPRS
jgi:hypothetical protein